MTLSTLTLARPATPARTPVAKPVAANPALLPGDAASTKASDKTREKTEAARATATSLETLQKDRRSALKAQAKAQVMALLDRIRTLRKFASDNPQVMARQLAAIVKELKSALKAYAAAGGTPGMDAGAANAPTTPSRAAPADGTADTDAPREDDAGTAPAAAEDAVAAEAGPSDVRDVAGTPAVAPTAADADPRNVYEKMRDSVSGSEAAGDMDFVKLVRGVGKVIRELLDKAKIQTALKGPDDETKKAFKAAEEGLRDIDEALGRMDREIRNSSPAAGMFVALYA